MTVEQSEAFVLQHKYDPWYEIVWLMVAGQLKDESLKRFFDLLQGAPRDLIGGRHHQLLAGCLREARPRLDKDTVARLENELMLWLQFETTLYGGSRREGILGKHNYFPEELLIKCLNQTTVLQKYALRALKGRTHLTSAAIDSLVASLHDSDNDIKILASNALSAHLTLLKSVVNALRRMLRDEDLNVSIAAAEALYAQSSLPDYIISELNDALRGDGVPFIAATRVLHSQAAKSEPEASTLFSALNDSEPFTDDDCVKRSAAQALGNQSSLPAIAFDDLSRALFERNIDVMISAARAFGAQSRLSKSLIQEFTESLCGRNSIRQ
ncbi:hypothetical protein BGX26_005785 [Mortierella sp. AD094]|nr:hypothetical protein BGX26_005785 [Mortierella sp. AD094]